MTNISDRHEYPSRDPGRAREHDRASRQTPHLVRGVAAHGMRVVDAPREIVVSDVEEFWDAIQARDTNPASGPMPMRIRVE